MKLLPAILAMAALVVASNVLVQFLLWDGFLTWGAFTYPFAFLVTDLTNRLHGAPAARRVVLAGFVTGVICSLIGTQVMTEFGPAVSLRIAIASKGLSGVTSRAASSPRRGMMNRSITE